MTSDPAEATSQRVPSETPDNAYVWVWLPGRLEPVVAGAITQTSNRLGGDPVIAFVYARSYREREDAISLFAPELPLRAGTFDPTRPADAAGPDQDGTTWNGRPAVFDRSPQALAGCLRDAAPDAWGRRVINNRLAADYDVQLGEMTYLLQAGSDRIGALDFQQSATEYVPRGQQATLDELVAVAELIERGMPIPEELAAAADHGTTIGGARPKALLTSGTREMVAKFASTTDTRPVVKAEAVGMLMAARVGIEVPPVEVITANGKDVLLVDRFDRTPTGARHLVVSGLTVLGLREEESRYASYVDLTLAMRHAGWADTADQLRELFTRMVLNIAISNTDDHLRNHAAFWDGASLRLTPAYDVAPQPRSTSVATHAIALTSAGERASQFWVARAAAADFLLDPAEADDVIDLVVSTIEHDWNEVCDEATLTQAERDQLWKREFLNDYAFYDESA
jgi:serine/threonine-protein kinase HipA